MRRVVALLVAVAVTLTLALAAGTASADVHGVSQANCGKSENSGAVASRHAIAHGRPAAPIPVTASGEKTQGKGGQASARGKHC